MAAVTLKTPLNVDVDANGHVIADASRMSGDWLIANQKVSINGAELLAGSADPSTGVDASTGSLYLRRAPGPGGTSTGELWMKVGLYPTDWQRIVP